MHENKDSFSFAITTTLESKEIFKKARNDFKPFDALNSFQNAISYFQSPIESIKDIAACWHWKEPDKEKSSCFSGEFGHDSNFTMGYKVFEALMRDYQAEDVSLTLATQGHIQSADLAYNKPFDRNQKAIFEGRGYGDA